MKGKIFFIICIISQMVSFAQTRPKEVSLDTLPTKSLRTLNYNAFQAEEYLRYRIHYGSMDAGEAELTIKNSDQKIQDRETFQIIGKGRSLGAFNWFFKIRDHYETRLDKKGVFPWIFVRDISEGGYDLKQNYVFHQHKKAVKTNKGETFATKSAVQDMLSAFYYARTLDFRNAKEGDVFSIETFIDSEEYTLKIKFVGREQLKSRAGNFNCLKFVPILQQGRIFKKEDDMMVWITDDDNKIPVLAKAKILVGSLQMELVEFKNLANPIAYYK
jgi:Protein of unknown function (DUF3108)